MNEKSGSFGQGVRAQVFEVIVRQALRGAPWREICAGPMTVNNIAPEEVEAEVKKRGGGLGPPFAPVPKRPKPSSGSGSASLGTPSSAMSQLLSVMELVSSLVKENKSADDDLKNKLDLLRSELDSLSDLMIDDEMAKNSAGSEALLQQDLEREILRTRQEIKPPDFKPPHQI